MGSSKGGDMSDEPLNLSNELLKSEELDVEGHLKDGADESEDKGADEVEGHLLDQNLLDL
jgi:hypothetical protein